MNTHDVLKTLVRGVTCKPGWSFTFAQEADESLRLVILVEGPNSRAPEEATRIAHYFPVPEATYNAKTWRRWVFECCRKVENHELGEWFLSAGERPFAPLHGPGEDPYTVHEFRDAVDARTNQRGTVEPVVNTLRCRTV